MSSTFLSEGVTALAAAGAVLFFGQSVVFAEDFIMPSSGLVYIKVLGGDGGAVTHFGVGSATTSFTPLLQGILDTTTEVLVGTFVQGAKLPFGMYTTLRVNLRGPSPTGQTSRRCGLSPILTTVSTWVGESSSKPLPLPGR